MTTTLPEAALEAGPAPPRPNAVEGLVEVDKIRELLRTNHEQLYAMESRIAAMEHAKRTVEQEAARERRFLMEQQDRFLRGLLDEHEQELSEITAERDAVLAAFEALKAQPAPDAHEEITREIALPTTEEAALQAGSRALEARLTDLEAESRKLVVERDRSRDVLLRLQQQRDHAFTEIASLKEQLRVTSARLPPRPAVAPPARSSQHSSATPRPPARAERSEPRASQIPPRRLTPPMPLGHLPPGAVASKAPTPARPLELGSLDTDWDRRTYPAPPPSMDAGPISAGSLEQGPAEAPSRSRPITRQTPPPAELRGALTHSDQTPTSPPPPLTAKSNPPTQTGSALGSDRPPLKQKPHHTERPLVDYALKADSVRPERIEPTSSKRSPR